MPDEQFSTQKKWFVASNMQKENVWLGLEKDILRIELVYNAVIPPFVHEDFPKEEGLFSLIDKRKPDIRLDLFTIKGNKKIFCSTLIVEVKYSPIFNIYQKKMKTKVMEQLKKYRSIVYVKRNKKGRATYIRDPVYDVICFYPGHEKLPIVLDTPIALYIQNYPKEEGNHIQFVGKTQMIQLVRKWMDEKGT